MKKIFSILFTLLFGLSTNAITVQVGSGTATSNFIPIFGFWGYSYVQQIYTQAQINSSGTIYKISFYHTEGTLTNSSDWVVYLGHTSKTEFANNNDWKPLSSLTKVFDGVVTSPGIGNWVGRR